MSKIYGNAIFDETCTSWTNDREANVEYLRYTKTRFDELLKHRGYVLLKEVFEALGFPVTESIVKSGWIYVGDEDYRYDSIGMEMFWIDVTGAEINTPNVFLEFEAIDNIHRYL